MTRQSARASWTGPSTAGATDSPPPAAAANATATTSLHTAHCAISCAFLASVAQVARTRAVLRATMSASLPRPLHAPWSILSADAAPPSRFSSNRLGETSFSPSTVIASTTLYYSERMRCRRRSFAAKETASTLARWRRLSAMCSCSDLWAASSGCVGASPTSHASTRTSFAVPRLAGSAWRSRRIRSAASAGRGSGRYSGDRAAQLAAAPLAVPEISAQSPLASLSAFSVSCGAGGILPTSWRRGRRRQRAGFPGTGPGPGRAPHAHHCVEDTTEAPQITCHVVGPALEHLGGDVAWGSSARHRPLQRPLLRPLRLVHGVQYLGDAKVCGDAPAQVGKWPGRWWRGSGPPRSRGGRNANRRA